MQWTKFASTPFLRHEELVCAVVLFAPAFRLMKPAPVQTIYLRLAFTMSGAVPHFKPIRWFVSSASRILSYEKA